MYYGKINPDDIMSSKSRKELAYFEQFLLTINIINPLAFLR